MSQTTPVKENKMGTMPVGRLLASMSIPMMLSMMVQALYNIVDSIFVSMISENALTAVSLAFPIQTLMISFAVGLAVGINAFLSRSLGQKNFENVNKSAVNGIPLHLQRRGNRSVKLRCAEAAGQRRGGRSGTQDQHAHSAALFSQFLPQK